MIQSLLIALLSVFASPAAQAPTTVTVHAPVQAPNPIQPLDTALPSP